MKQKTWGIVLATTGSAVAAPVLMRRSAFVGNRWHWRSRASVLHDASEVAVWRFNQPFATLPVGKVLRFELVAPAIVHWTTDQWDNVRDTRSTELRKGVHAIDLPTEELPTGSRVQFTFYWPLANRWEGEDFEVRVEYAARHAS